MRISFRIAAAAALLATVRAQLEEICVCSHGPPHVIKGSVDAHQRNGLQTLTMSGRDDDPFADYVEATLSHEHEFEAIVNFQLPAHLPADRVHKISTRANFRGERARNSRDQWELQLAPVASHPRAWERVWNNFNVREWVWSYKATDSTPHAPFASYLKRDGSVDVRMVATKNPQEPALFDFIELCVYVSPAPTARPTTAHPTGRPSRAPTERPTTAHPTGRPTQGCFLPDKLHTIRGHTGAHQTVQGLRVLQMSGQQEVWEQIVEFIPDADGTGAEFVVSFDVSSFHAQPGVALLDWNFRGQRRVFQTWRLEILNYGTSRWELLALTPLRSAKSWTWAQQHDSTSLSTGAHAAYIKEGTALVRFSTRSSRDAAQLDFLQLCLEPAH